MTNRPLKNEMSLDGRTFINGIKQATTAMDAATARLEYNLQVAARYDCDCWKYLQARKEIILPKLIEKAAAEDRPSEEVIAEFCRSVHERHLAGKPLFS